MDFPTLPPTPTFTLAPAKTALIVVDMQNDFCHPAGAYMEGPWDGTEFNQAIGPNVAMVAKARAAGVPVFFSRILHELGKAPNDQPNRLKARHALVRAKQAIVKGTWGAEIVDELKPLPGEIVVDKEVGSAFHGTDLDAHLRRLGIETVIITGVVTYACVLATAYGARDRGYNVLLLKEAVGSFWSDMNEPVFKLVNLLMGHAVNIDNIQFQSAAVAA